MKVLIKIAWRNIWRNSVRSLVIITSIVLGLWIGTFVNALYYGMGEDRVNIAIQNEISHIQIHHPGFKENYKAKYVVRLDDTLKAKLSNTANVQSWSARTIAPGMLATTSGSTGMQINGVDPAAEDSTTHLASKITEGKYQSLSIESSDDKKALLVGSEGECLRAEKLLSLAGADSEVVSFVSNPKDLAQLAEVYDINEIIFCSRDLTFGQIINNIGLCGNKIDYKILNPGSEAFIGSNSKNTAGDLYSVNHNLNLARPASQRKKRLFDVISSLTFIVLLPVNLFVIKNFGKFVSNWLAVARGTKTWVGYALPATGNLPAVKHGVLNTAASFDGLQLDADTLSKINLLYARHYTVLHDLKLMWQNYRKLGG